MLRRASAEDAAMITAWLNDTDNSRYLAENLRLRQLNGGVVKVALRRSDQAWYIYSSGIGEANRPAGLVALDHVERFDGVANLWYVLGEKEFSRQGLTTRAIVEFCELNPLSLNVAVAWSAETNIASVRCLQKAGFNLVGTIPNAFAFTDGLRCARQLFFRPFGPAAGC